MATIKSSIIIQDMASSVITKIYSNVTKTTKGFKDLNEEMSVAPTNTINNMEKINASAIQTELAYKAELQVLKQVEAESRKIIATEGTRTAKAQDIIESVMEQRTLVESLKKDYDNISASIKNANANQEQLNNSLNTANKNSSGLLGKVKEMVSGTKGVKNVKSNYDNVSESIKDTNNKQEELNTGINTATNNGNKLLNTVKNIAIAVGGIKTVKNLMSLSDDMTNNKARLGLIVDDKGSVEDLQNKIFASSMNARASYQTTMDTVTKLGLQAGKAFKNNDELIAFTEQLNKTFVISGTTATGIESTMYNLTQALSTGVLRGQDLNSVFSNAPQIVQNIADYLDVPIGKIRDMAANGKISAEIVKNAMLKATNETNAKFDKMPMTWSQIFTRMKNIAIKALEPVLTKINQLANNQRVQQMFKMFIDGASLAGQAILILIDGISWLVNILEPVAPLILGIVAAYVAFNVVSGIVNAMIGINTFLTAVNTAAEAIHNGISLERVRIMKLETGAQIGLNAAMLACPATWIAIIIIALIAVLTYLWFTNDKVAYWILFAWDAIRVGAMILGLGVKTVFFGLILAGQYFALGMMGVCYLILGAWYAFQTGLQTVGIGILYIFQWLYNGVMLVVNGIIGLLNKIPGVSINTAEYANFADKAVEGMMNDVVRRNEDLQNIVDDMNSVNESIEKNKAKFGAELYNDTQKINNKAIEFMTTRDDRVAHRNDWINGASEAVNNALNNFNLDPSNFSGDSTIGNIADNTKNIADNTKEISEEDLKYLIDIAERDTINRFTTVPLTINLTNNNSINGQDDIDGIVDQVTNKLTSRLEAELEYVSEGVHV